MRLLHFFRISALVTAGFAVAAGAIDFHAPAGNRYAQIGGSGAILPGGRLLRPLGTLLETGPGPFGLVVSRNGTVATADTGPERYGVTIIEPPGKGPWRERHIWARTPHSRAPEIADPDWKSVADGITFDSSGKAVWISEGDSGRLRELDLNTGDTRRAISVNGGEWQNSFTGDLVQDTARRLFYVVDKINSRVAVFDVRTGRVVSSVKVDRQPSAIALAPEGSTVYVTNADSVCAIDVRDDMKPGPAECTRTGSPGAVMALQDRVYVSNKDKDSITILSGHDRRIIADIPLRIPSLEQYRGLVPGGMAYDPVTKWLLVAETGINAVGIVDTQKNVLIGHLPAGWMPTKVAISGDRVYVANALGRGTGPNWRAPILGLGEVPTLYHGAITTFIMPDQSEILKQTGTVFANDGFVPWMHDTPRFPEAIRHVVLIVKAGWTFDEVLGDITRAGNGAVQGFPKLAHFGMHGWAIGNSSRFSIQDAAVTPNHHAIAQRWAFGDNFYVDGGAAASEEPFWHHLESGGVTFLRLDDREKVSDQQRADRFITELDKGPLPAFVYIHLPAAQPSGKYPYEASLVEDNDLALGRILDRLSRSEAWPETAVFVTESNPQSGFDHIDSHRTPLLAASPYAKRNYVSHTNASVAGLRRTIFELLHLPPLDLSDASASSLRDMFTDIPDLTPFTTLRPDPRIFDPAMAK